MKKGVHMPLLLTLILLIVFGFFIFISGSLGLVSSEGETVFTKVIMKQFLFGLGGVIAMLIVAYKIPYKVWQKYAMPLFIISLFATAIVLIPGVGASHGGATRWIDIGGISFQPGEFLKLGFVVYFAAWLSAKKQAVETFWGGFVPLCVFLALVGAVLLAQPHTGMLIIICVAAASMFVVAGGRWRYLFLLAGIGIIGLTIVAFARPYVMERLTTFWNLDTVNPQDEGWQVRQSLIAIGSGELFGKGFGQSAQKFSYLPEAIGDSIFAVAGEEFGFIGATSIILLFLFFAFAGFRVAARAPDPFGRLVVLGLVILIVSQSFINIGAMLGIMPLSGVPVLFISQGGTALFFTLLEAGIILSVSRGRV